MIKARKDHFCMFCKGWIKKGEHYSAWMEADEVEDFIGSKTVAFRVHHECFDLYNALGGDFETNDDVMYEFLGEILYKSEEYEKLLRKKYRKHAKESYEDWIMYAIDDGIEPDFSRYWKNEELDKVKSSWAEWLKWRKDHNIFEVNENEMK